MTSEIDRDQLLFTLETALAQADELGDTLAAAMIVECIVTVRENAAKARA